MTEAQKTFLRFGILERIEHFILVLSFTTLGVTGLPQKFALNPLSQAVIGFFGGIESTRIVHRIAATVFLLQAIYHVVMVGYKVYVRRKEATMLPGIKDGQDALQWFGFNLGFFNKRPKMPRYNFMEKAEYWAMLWGLVLMGLTGLMLWNPIATTNLLPGEFIPAAKAAHGAEAVLAVLAIFLWHFYNVHIKHWNWSMIRGTLGRHEMEEEHAEELEEIQSGRATQAVKPEVARQRLTLFAPVATVLSIALVGMTVYFLTFEQTAITTVPPAEQGPIYVRATPTLAPTKHVEPPTVIGGEPTTASVSWTGGIEDIMQEKCTSCHGSIGGFNAESYDDVMKAVTPSDPEASKIVEVQQAGGHPGQLSEAELNTLIEWIKAGAPQEGSAQGTPEQGEGEVPGSWDGGISTLFADKCSGCHGAMGDYNVETYDDVMKAIQPGDPGASKVVEVQQAGGHPGQFNDNELNIIVNWIQAGAPQQ